MPITGNTVNGGSRMEKSDQSSVISLGTGPITWYESQWRRPRDRGI